MQLIDPKVFGGTTFDDLKKARLTPSVEGHPPFLRLKSTGEVFPWSEALAERGDLMEPAWEFTLPPTQTLRPSRVPPRFDGGQQSAKLATAGATNGNTEAAT